MVSDEALHERVRQGDIAAFDDLYARYERPLFAFVVRLLGDRAEAEDVLHEAFLETLRTKSTQFDRAGGFRAWLYQVARHLCLNRQRTSRRGAAALARAPEQVPDKLPEAVLQEREAARALDAAVSRLPSPLAEVFQLRASGLSYEEMAHVLDVPLGTVKSRLHQTVSQLRKEMASWNVK